MDELNHKYEEWFHGQIARKLAEQKLHESTDGFDGLFLVRESLTLPGRYCASVLLGREVYHVLVSQNDAGHYYIGSSRSGHRSLKELVEMYMMTGKSIICTNDCRLQLLAPVPRPVTSQATQDVPAPSAPLSPHQYVTADADSLLDASSISCSLGIATRAAETPSPVTDAAIEDLSEVALSPGPGAHRCRLPPRDYINTNELSFWPSNAKGDLSFDNMDTLPRFEGQYMSQPSTCSQASCDSGVGTGPPQVITGRRTNSTDSGCWMEAVTSKDLEAPEDSASIGRRFAQSGARCVRKCVKWIRSSSANEGPQTSDRAESYEMRAVSSHHPPTRTNDGSASDNSKKQGQVFERGLCVHLQRQAENDAQEGGHEGKKKPSRLFQIHRPLSQSNSKSRQRYSSSWTGMEAANLLDDDQAPCIRSTSPTEPGRALRCAVCEHSLALHKNRHALAHRHRTTATHSQCCAPSSTSGQPAGSFVGTATNSRNAQQPESMRAADMFAILRRLNS